MSINGSSSGNGNYWVSVLSCTPAPTGVSWAPAVQGNKELGPQQLVSNSSNCQLVPTVNHNLRAVKIATVL